MGSMFRQIFQERRGRIFSLNRKNAPSTITDEEFSQIVSELKQSGIKTNAGVQEFLVQKNVLKEREKFSEEETELESTRLSRRITKYLIERSQSLRESITKIPPQSSNAPIYRRSSDYQPTYALSPNSDANEAVSYLDSSNSSDNLDFIYVTCDENEIEDEDSLHFENSSKKNKQRRSSYLVALEDFEINDTIAEGELMVDFPRRSSTFPKRISFVVKLESNDESDFDDHHDYAI